jgi:HK97 family phage portal protein
MLALRQAEQLRAAGSGTRYDVTDIESGVLTQSFTVDYNTAPSWPASAYRNGMSIPGAWRASILLSDMLGSIPWHAYRKPIPGDRDPAPRLVEPGPPLLEQPSPPDSRMDTLSSAALDYLWNGNAIGIITSRDRYGVPTSAAFVEASMVFVRRVDERNYPLPIGTIEYMIGDLSFTPDEVIHIKGPHAPGALRGLGVLESHLPTLGLAEDLQATAGNLTGYGVPTGLLKSEDPDLTQVEAEKLKIKWLNAQRTRTIAVLNATTSFEPLGWNPQEAQLVEARKFSLSELELIFGLPVGWLGGSTSTRQYSNIEQDAVNLIKFTMLGHLSRFKQTLSGVLPRGQFVEPDLDELLRSDTLARYQGYASGITAGWLLRSEARAKERLVAVDGIDDGPAPQNTADPSTAGAPGTPTSSSGSSEVERIEA